MRQIKLGDVVQAFWDANIKGEVVNLGSESHSVHLVGGTLESTPFCDVKLQSERVVRVKLSEVFHVY